MRGLLKALFSSFMWIAFMSLTKEILTPWAFWVFLFSGIVFFNILFQDER